MTLVDPGVSFGVEGFTAFRGKVFREEMKLCRRYYPHTHNMDGFFIAKMVKKMKREKRGGGDGYEGRGRVETGVFGKKKKKEKVVGEDEKEEIKFDEKEDEKYLDLNGAVDSSIPPSPSPSLIRVEKKKREKGGVAVKRTFSQMTEFPSTKEGTNISTIAIETTNTNKRRDDEDDHVLPILSRSEKKQRKKQAMERLLGGS